MSTLLSSEDLNDFIKPSVACIKPVENLNQDNGSTIQIGDDENPLEVFVDGTAKSLQPAQISLSDCLACSGCITSAEEILVAQHSHKELLSVLKKNTGNEVKFVASISHQSRASLAHAFNVTIATMDLVLIDLFVNKFGFQYVVGTELGRLISLKQSIKEITNHRQQKQKQSASKNHGPLMCSVCPGWVLYVEKTHPEIIPNMSKVKSAQQITGCLLKNCSAKSLNVPLEKVYHVAIMPCFDKKLEAARPEKEQDNRPPANDVDCVITAKELVQLMNDENILFENYVNDFKSKPDILDLEKNIDEIYKKYSPELFKFGAESWYSNLGSASGGYAYNYIAYLKKLHADKNTEVVKVEGRNNDVVEYRLVGMTGDENLEVLGSVAVINGFRNIQNLIRKVGELNGTKKTIRKRGALAARRRANAQSSNGGEIGTVVDTREKKIAAALEQIKSQPADGIKCDYVEVMACPGGCINGGGQISAPESIGGNTITGTGAAKAWQADSEIKYLSMTTIQDINTEELYSSLQQYVKEFGLYFHVDESRLTETYFNKVESDALDDSAIALTSKW